MLDILKQNPLFTGLSDMEIESALQCLDTKRRSYQKGEYIAFAGTHLSSMGIILSGTILIIQEDFLGNRSIVENLTSGEAFGLSFATFEGSTLNVSIVAESRAEVLFIDINKVLNTCSNNCVFHTHLIHNLVSLLSLKNLKMNEKLTHMSKRSTREKLLSFLSAYSVKQKSKEFSIPYDRQSLADYLCVERAAMCVELSRLQKEGLIEYHKNRFRLNS